MSYWLIVHSLLPDNIMCLSLLNQKKKTPSHDNVKRHMSFELFWSELCKIFPILWWKELRKAWWELTQSSQQTFFLQKNTLLEAILPLYEWHYSENAV